MTIAPGLRPNGKSVYHEHCIPTNVKYADSRRESQIRNKIQLGLLACSSQDFKSLQLVGTLRILITFQNRPDTTLKLLPIML